MMTDSLTATQWPDRVQTASVVRTSNRIRTIRQQTCVKHHGGHYYYSKRTKSSLDWLPGTCHCSPVLFLFCFFLPFSLVLSSCRGDEPAVPSEHHHQDRSTVVDLPPIDLAVPISDDSTRPSAVDPAETGDWGEDGQRSARSRSRRHCPSCQMTGSSDLQHQQQRHKPPLEQEQEQTAGDSARLESIKRQILVKLGLNAKPDLLSTMPPRDFILETLLRAEESTVAAAPAVRPPSSSRSDHHHHHHHSSSSSDSGGTDLNSVEDDFYGKTSEIIAFGEPGPRLNGQVLAEFSRVQETTPEPSLRVKSATLWLYVHIRQQQQQSNPLSSHPKSRHRHSSNNQQQQTTSAGANEKQQQQQHRRSPTLYVFRLLSHQQQHRPYTSSNLSLDKNWNELLASQRVTIQHSGWMKINVTEGVQKWFSTSSSSSSTSGNNSNSKLRLLVDCSGCGSTVQPVLFSSSSSSSSTSTNNSSLESSKKKKKKRRRRRRRRRRLVETNDREEEEELIENDEELLRAGATGAASDEPEAHDPEAGRKRQQQHRPFIVIHTDSSSWRRLRRRTPLDCSPTTSACCKQRFFVSFRSLGWDDWIIAPSGYYANYCRGNCGGGLHGPSRSPDTFLSYHSHVIDQVRKIQPAAAATAPLLSSSASWLPLFGSTTSTSQQQQQQQKEASDRLQQQQQQQLYASLQPCCAPTKFSSMSLIYFGPDMNIIKRDLPKMVVDECGCP